MSNKILEQVKLKPDILLDNPQIIFCREVIKNLNTSIEKLLDLQLVVPIFYPWDDEYFCYLQEQKNPYFILVATSVQDIQITVEWCYDRNIPLNKILINQSKRDNVIIQDDDAIVILEAGCLIGSTQLKLSKKNLALVTEEFPNKNIIDSTLKGGIGFLTRKYGLSSDNLLEAEIILEDGEIIRCNSKTHQDLFFKIRGNGTGILVTEMVFKVHHITKVNVFKFTFNYDMEIINTWQIWAPFISKNLTSELYIKDYIITISGLYLGCDNSLEKLLHPFLQLKYLNHEIKRLNFLDACRYFAVPYEIPKRIEYIKEVCSFNNSHLKLKALGGIMNNIPSNKTAFPHRKDTLFCMIKY